MSLSEVLRHAKPDAFAMMIGTGLLTGGRIPDSPASDIAVFEPDLNRFDLLRLRHFDRKGLTIRNASVGTQPGPLPMRHFNYAALDGFADPDALRTAFPGLSIRSEVSAKQTTLTNLPTLLPESTENLDILVIDRLGGEWDILQSFADTGMLLRFAEVVVRTTRSDLLAEGHDAQTLIDWMQDQDFDRWIETGQPDSDFPILHFSRNFLSGEVRALQGEVHTLQGEVHTLQGEAHTLQGEVHTLHDEVRALKDELSKPPKAEVDRSRAIDDLEDLQARYAAQTSTLAELQALLTEILQDVAPPDPGKAPKTKRTKAKPATAKKGK